MTDDFDRRLLALVRQRLDPTPPTERDPMSNDTDDLITRLRDLAENLEQGAEPKADEQPEAPEPTDAEAFVDELKARSEKSWTSIPGLLDR